MLQRRNQVGSQKSLIDGSRWEGDRDGSQEDLSQSLEVGIYRLISEREPAKFQRKMYFRRIASAKFGMAKRKKLFIVEILSERLPARAAVIAAHGMEIITARS